MVFGNGIKNRQEGAGRDDWDLPDLPKSEKLNIARDKVIDAGRDSSGQNLVILGVSGDPMEFDAGYGNCGTALEYCGSSFDLSSRTVRSVIGLAQGSHNFRYDVGGMPRVQIRCVPTDE